tara:strand:+ start:165 stop:521 length:357 start_codon:yes stop_codon:yes gene_type:complete
MKFSNISIRSDYSILSKKNEFAIVPKKSFFEAMDFIKSIITEKAFNNIVNRHKVIMPDIKAIDVDNDCVIKDYIVINLTNFNYFVIAIKILMEDNYQLLKDKYQFDIIPLEVKFDNCF